MLFGFVKNRPKTSALVTAVVGVTGYLAYRKLTETTSIPSNREEVIDRMSEGYKIMRGKTKSPPYFV